MALVYCPNCRSANSSRERRCWICQKALAPPSANPTGRPLSYPQKMRLVRFEETVSGTDGDVSCRIVYVKSVEDKRPVRDYWQAARDQQMLRLRRIYAGTAAALSVGLVATLFGLSSPAPAETPIKMAAPPIAYITPDNPLAHTILPPQQAITENSPAHFAVPLAYRPPENYSVNPPPLQAM